jgi:GNAT superfamily N-acetyltransferase
MVFVDVDFLTAESNLEVRTAAEEPDLWDASHDHFSESWPEYNMHGNDTGQVFGELIARFPSFQILIVDRDLDRAVARGRTVPFRWDGSLEDLPPGIDALGPRLQDPAAPTTLSALAAEVSLDQQGRGLSRLVLRAMAQCARVGDLRSLVAPVRPSWKDRYPLIALEQYVEWHRDDGLPFDPWMRVHSRLGAVILRVEDRSLRIEAPVAEWEAWTEMAFPEDGRYTFPGGLAPLTVKDGVGSYWEPNVWMQHEL